MRLPPPPPPPPHPPPPPSPPPALPPPHLHGRTFIGLPFGKNYLLLLHMGRGFRGSPMPAFRAASSSVFAWGPNFGRPFRQKNSSSSIFALSQKRKVTLALQKSTKNLPKLGSWELLGLLVGLLEGSWAHLGSKSQQVTKKLVRLTPLAPPSWTQDPPKIH